MKKSNKFALVMFNILFSMRLISSLFCNHKLLFFSILFLPIFFSLYMNTHLPCVSGSTTLSHVASSNRMRIRAVSTQTMQNNTIIQYKLDLSCKIFLK